LLAVDGIDLLKEVSVSVVIKNVNLTADFIPDFFHSFVNLVSVQPFILQYRCYAIFLQGFLKL
jgi:hypothetical protein